MTDALMPRGFTEEWADTGQVRLHIVRGPRNGLTPLLLVHGQSVSWRSYARVLADLANDFEVYAADCRGHGASGWTPGEYRWDTLGADAVFLLREVVGRPAIVSGNSSGGIIVGIAAAESPEMVLGWMPEDPPLFSSEWPRLRDETYIARVFALCGEALERPEGRDLGAFIEGLDVPSDGRKVSVTLPPSLRSSIARYLRRYQAKHPGEPVDLPLLPLDLRVFIRGLSEYDPGFTRAFLDGTAEAPCNDHAALLSRISCPTLLLCANSFVHPEFGLVGAMTDDDVARFRDCMPSAEVRHIDTQHMIHIGKPAAFTRAVRDLARLAGT